jgi:methionine-rich copper-binding protein CopC
MLMKTLFIVLSLLSSSLAFAHAHLSSSEPKQGSTVAHLPEQVVLHFSEALEPSLCKVVVKVKATGETISTGNPESVDPKSLRLALPARKADAATYEVDWKAVSKDTHKSSGSFDFTVGPS